MPRPKGKLRHFFTKVAGVTHNNPDGSSRQRIIAHCRVRETLELDHEEDNPNDPNAVRVLRNNKEQVGYISADLAEEIIEKSRRGYRYGVFINDLTGGTTERPTRGVNLVIVVAPPDTTDDEVQEYTDRTFPPRARSGLDTQENAKKGGCMNVLLCLAVALSLFFLLT